MGEQDTAAHFFRESRSPLGSAFSVFRGGSTQPGLQVRPHADTRVVRGHLRGNIDPLAYALSHTWVTVAGTRERMWWRS